MKLNLYRVEQCGFYERGEDTLELANLKELLSNLFDWTQDLELQETKTYDWENNPPTYCLDLLSDDATEDFLLTTWNQTGNESLTSQTNTIEKD